MTTTGCALVSRSNVRGIRGETSPTVLGGATRYIYIILDDIENEANIKTFESRDYIKRSVTNAVYPALDEQRGRLIFNGTPIHADSLCQNILDGYRRAREKGVENEYSWRVISYAATQPEMPGGVLWHSYISKTSLEKKRKFYLDTYGTDDGYMQEYELVPYGSDSRIWTSDHYGYHTCNYFWNEEQQQSYLNWHGTIFPVNCFLGSDPATDVDTERTDDSVIMVVAVDKLGRIFVLEYIAKRAIPSISIKDPDTGEIITELGVVDYIFQLYDKYHCLNGTVEDCGMTRGIFNDIQAEKVRLKRFDIIIHGEKPAGREKLGKIKTGLNPSFAQRLIHVRENHYKLREQIEGMGLGMTHEDVLESLFFATRHIVKPTLEKKGQGYVKRAMSQVKSWVVA